MPTVRSRSTRNITKDIYTNGHNIEEKPDYDHKDMIPTVALADYAFTLSLVFGGCCSNVWSLERLLQHDHSMGSALTFLQLSFIATQSLPSFLTRPPPTSRFPFNLVPRFKPPAIPLRVWAIQVVVLVSVNLLNNWAFAYQIPLPLQTVFRSGGLAVSMLFGWGFLGRRYSKGQIISVLLVSLGVITATLSRPVLPSSASTDQDRAANARTYSIGIGLLTTSLLLSGVLGILQEKTYKQYGGHWREGVFYTHALALPIFSFLISDVKRGLKVLSRDEVLNGGAALFSQLPIPASILDKIPIDSIVVKPIYVVLLMNLVTQLVCVSGVNRLTSTVSSVSTNLVLTARKAFSLVLSVWWFGSGWNRGLVLGGSLVFAGSVLYSMSSDLEKERPKANGVTRANGLHRRVKGKAK